jgi:flagellin
MSTINTNVQSMVAQRVLGQQNQQLNNTLQKLSTGLRIQQGKDDPSGLIASENLRAQETAINSAIGNAERADSMMSTAEGGLKEVSSQLRELQSLVTTSANDSGLSKEEKEANQQEVDAILQSIDRIADTTNFQGKKLLNGSFDFQVESQDGSVASRKINGASLDSGNLDVQATVTQSAQTAALDLSAGGNTLSANGDVTIEVAGTKGSKEFTFGSSTALSNVASEINSFSSELGVSAAASGNVVNINSQNFGSEEFVSVDVVNANGQGGKVESTDFGSVNNAIRQEGQDVAATVNGQAVTGEGKTLNINTDQIDAEVSLTTSAAQNTGTTQSLFTVSGGGAQFSIGADVGPDTSERMSLGNVQSRNLGTSQVNPNNNGEKTLSLDALAAGGDLNVVDGDMESAQKVVENAISEVSNLRGRIGSFQKNTLEPTMSNLNVAKENTASAESNIRDTDFANATAELTRSQILSQSARNSLSIANSNPRSALSLLGG